MWNNVSKGWASLNKFILGGWGGAEGGKRWAKGPIERPSDCIIVRPYNRRFYSHILYRAIVSDLFKYTASLINRSFFDFNFRQFKTNCITSLASYKLFCVELLVSFSSIPPPPNLCFGVGLIKTFSIINAHLCPHLLSCFPADPWIMIFQLKTT